MILVPPQPTLTDVMIALETLNKNIAQLSNQIDDGFKAQELSGWKNAITTYQSAVTHYLFPTWDNTQRLINWASNGGGCRFP